MSRKIPTINKSFCFTLKAKLIMTCLLMVITTITIIVMMKNSTDQVKINGPLYQDIISGKDLIADILPPPEYALEPFLVVLQALAEKDTSRITGYTVQFKKLRQSFDERYAFWAKLLPADSLRRILLERSYQPATLFFDKALQEYFPALMAGDHLRAEKLVRETLSPAYGVHRRAIDELLRQCTVENIKKERDASALLHRSNIETLAISVLFLGVILTVFLLVIRHLTRQLRQAIAVADTIADGNVHIEIQVTAQDEIGHLMAAMSKMVDTIRLLINDSSMLTNAAITGDLSIRVDPSRHRGEFRKIVSGVNATLDTVIGPLQTAADCLHQLGDGKIPAEITGQYPGDYQTIKTGANAVIAAVRMRGQDLELLNNAAQQGNLSVRADSSRYSGYHHTMISSVNEILDRLTSPLTVAATSIDRIARGDIPPKITDNYHGDFNILKNNLNNCIDIMNNLLNEASRVLQAAADGALDERANATLFVGEWQQLVLSVNNIVTNIVTPLRQTTQRLNQEIKEREKVQELLLAQQYQLETFNAELEETIAEEVKKNREKDRALMHNEKMISLGHLTAGVAHEINNPMGYISSNLRALTEYFEEITLFCSNRGHDEGNKSSPVGTDDKDATDIEVILEDGSELIKECLEGAERVKTIIQDMKSFSRMDSLHMQPVELSTCLEKALNICHNELKYVANISKEYEPGSIALCHPGQLNQVFLNLLVNAGQSMTMPGKIMLRCFHDETFVYASVSDTGSGITKEVLEKIFDPFFTTKETNEGTGLGLSISHEIIKRHNGELLVESIVGQGTKFTIKLPLVQETSQNETSSRT